MSQDIMEKRYEMESKADLKDVIVIDNGSSTIKIGFSGEDKPRVQIKLFKHS